MTAQEDLTGMPIPKQDERTPGPWRSVPCANYAYDIYGGPNNRLVALDASKADAAFIVQAVNAYTSTEALREALAPFAKLHDEILFCAGANGNPDNWCKSCAWPDLKRAKEAYDALAGVTAPLLDTAKDTGGAL